MLRIAPDRLLHMFRVTAGLPSTADPLGGWEQPVNELRGHFTGHYLSACAQISAHLGDDAFRKIGNNLVTQLAQCQKAHGNGYLSAFPEEFFDRLRADQKVWAPFYTLHKIMAGLLDMSLHCGNEQAFDVLQGMVTWVRRWAQPLGEAQMARVLEREYGGMNDLLYGFYAITGKEEDHDLAHRFDHERIFAPLSEFRDDLKGLHVNTTIPKIIGAARRYEMIGESRYRDIAEYFWREVTEQRAYCTGGTSNGEEWGTDPGRLAGALSGYTQECCCTYNMLKLTRHIFQWTADPRCADYYERALFNGILGTQHPDDGMTLYYVPLASGYWKLFGLPFDAFWCCTGTGLESFSKLGDSIYFHDDEGLYINLFIASELDWKEKEVRVQQTTRIPEEDSTSVTIHCKHPARWKLRLRVPYWAAAGGFAALNGKRLEGFAEPGGYFTIDRMWADGDRVDLKLPMGLHAHPMPDDDSIRAFLYGPLVLVGRLGTEGLTPSLLRAEPTKPRTVPEYKAEPVAAPELKAASKNPADWIHAHPEHPLEFHAEEVQLVPFYKLFDERYAVYWKMAR
ncbi:MAG TPA: beta-L-arabinofuranosidase domain-containing protein [Acidobacteriota bacterium]|nr:beta-L-arabinofuranosidase domain-containing protein [Acidobacteriota bacterium]